MRNKMLLNRVSYSNAKYFDNGRTDFDEFSSRVSGRRASESRAPQRKTARTSEKCTRDLSARTNIENSFSLTIGLGASRYGKDERRRFESNGGRKERLRKRRTNFRCKYHPSDAYDTRTGAACTRICSYRYRAYLHTWRRRASVYKISKNRKVRIRTNCAAGGAGKYDRTYEPSTTDENMHSDSFSLFLCHRSSHAGRRSIRKQSLRSNINNAMFDSMGYLRKMRPLLQ